MKRNVLIPCKCGIVYSTPDPRRSVNIRCKSCKASLSYDCYSDSFYCLRHEQTDYELKHSMVIIGRVPPADIVIDYSGLSRKHCMLEMTTVGYRIKDAGSTNGTFVNGQQLEHDEFLPLQAGDLIEMGDLCFRYLVPRHPVEIIVEDGVLVCDPDQQQQELEQGAAEEEDDEGVPLLRPPGAMEGEASDPESAEVDLVEKPPPAMDQAQPEDAQVQEELVEDEEDEVDEEPDVQTDVLAMPEKMIGEKIGNFEILAFMGRDVMGQIYRARQIHLDRECILNALQPRVKVSEDDFFGFIREIMTAAKVVHPNIIMFYDAKQANGLWYLAMEYFAGTNLYRKYRDQQAPFDEVLGVGRQTSAALHAAHREGMLHQDLKPSNILIDDTGHLKVMGFGIAKACANLQYAQLLSFDPRTEALPYKAPEILSDNEVVDVRADIYSLGAVMYFCLTGHAPFQGTTKEELMFEIPQRPPRISVYRSNVPDQLERAIFKAMANRREDRYQSAKEFAGAIKASLRSSQVIA